jgi:hypothetical protein
MPAAASRGELETLAGARAGHSAEAGQGLPLSSKNPMDRMGEQASQVAASPARSYPQPVQATQIT